MADGKGGVVNWVEPGYDEPDRSTGNRMQTDYAQGQKTRETRRQAFDDGSTR